MLAEYQHLAGDSKAAVKTLKQALKVVDDPELEAAYEERMKGYR